MKRTIVAVALLVLGALEVAAQPPQAPIARVYASCPSVRSTAYPVGVVGELAIDINGNLCTAAAGSGSTPVSPTGAATTQAAVAPTATVFSTVLAASASRKNCLVQNIGTTGGYIFFGANGSATTSNSFQIAAGQTISCTAGVTVATDNVAGTCASSTCAFIVSSQ